MTMGRNLSIEEEQAFWAALFGVMVRHEERIRAVPRADPDVATDEPVSFSLSPSHASTLSGHLDMSSSNNAANFFAL